MTRYLVLSALLLSFGACRSQTPAEAPAADPAALSAAPATVTPAAAARDKAVTIAFLHTANVMGELEPCG